MEPGRTLRRHVGEKLALGTKAQAVAAWRLGEKVDSGPRNTTRGDKGETGGRRKDDVMLTAWRRKRKIAMDNMCYATTNASLGNGIREHKGDTEHRSPVVSQCVAGRGTGDNHGCDRLSKRRRND